ncbi:MAG: hypothetical protein ACLQVI_19875 [Polyangiaceae bacterium]
MRELFRTKQSVVTVDEGARVLRRARTAEQFESAGQLEAEYDELVSAMDLVDRTRYAQLVDVRSAPPRNDPEFEKTVARHHADLYRGFLANAVLVHSAVGKLHVKRLLDASGANARVFSDEGEALAYLEEAVRESRKP